MSAPAPARRRVAAHGHLELRLLLRSGESLLLTFGVPLGLLVLLATTDIVDVPAADEPLDFLVPGVLALAIMSTGFVAQAIQTGFERKYGVLKRLGTSPLTRPDFVVGKAGAVAVVVVAQVVVLMAVAALLGWDVRAGTWNVPLLVVGVVLGAAVFTALGLALAGAVTAELVLAGANAIYLVLLGVSDLVLDLPAAADPFVLATPSGALGIVLRHALGPVPDPRWPAAVAVLVAWGVVAVVVASRTFRWEP